MNNTILGILMYVIKRIASANTKLNMFQPCNQLRKWIA